jgi:hypothetical protein
MDGLIIVHISNERMAQVPLAKDDDMVNTFPSDRANRLWHVRGVYLSIGGALRPIPAHYSVWESWAFWVPLHPTNGLESATTELACQSPTRGFKARGAMCTN